MDEAEMFDFLDDPDEREQAAEVFRLGTAVDVELAEEQELLGRVAHDDPVGAVWFGEWPRAADADEWWARQRSRLHGKPRK